MLLWWQSNGTNSMLYEEKARITRVNPVGILARCVVGVSSGGEKCSNLFRLVLLMMFKFSISAPLSPFFDVGR